MKKFIALFFALLSVFILSGVIYAGLDSKPHVLIGGLIKFSGSVKNVSIEEPGNKGFNYRPNNNKDWADSKFRGNVRTGVINLLPDKKFVNKPVAANKIPTAKTGLINPNDPLILMTYDNKIRFGFDYDIVDLYSVRLLNDKGKSLGSVEGRWDTQPKPVDITLPRGTNNYYLEFCDSSKKPSKYCYYLLKISTDDTAPKEDPETTARMKENQKRADQLENIMSDYEKKTNKTRDNFNDDDMKNISNAYVDSYMEEEGMLDQKQIFDAYMKQHNIKSYQDLTEKDMEAISRQMFKQQIKSMPASYRAKVDNYMKQHKIKSYDNLTQKDFEAISKLLGD